MFRAQRHGQGKEDWAKTDLKTDFSKVLWTDGMRVTLDGPDGWAHCWISNGHRAPLRIRRQQGGGRVLVRAGITKAVFRCPSAHAHFADLYKSSLGGHFQADLVLKSILGSLKETDRTIAMASSGSYVQVALVLLAVQLVCVGAAEADQETGTVIPAESRPCVDCHAFEFMQRALQDLKKTAFNLDARTETLVLRAEQRALCGCMATTTLR
ncbi:neuropeptide-like protein C4orf48 homolog isoform X1 [Xiphophorus maculatus]|nr:neuropeptide-like protein C4orf48 homolog isoform X1 [Xiphophorus maculatus]